MSAPSRGLGASRRRRAPAVRLGPYNPRTSRTFSMMSLLLLATECQLRESRPSSHSPLLLQGSSYIQVRNGRTIHEGWVCSRLVNIIRSDLKCVTVEAPWTTRCPTTSASRMFQASVQRVGGWLPSGWSEGGLAGGHSGAGAGTRRVP